MNILPQMYLDEEEVFKFWNLSTFGSWFVKIQKLRPEAELYRQ